MKFLFSIFCCFNITALKAQELFVYSEPASNMATKSIGIRANNYLMRETATGNYSHSFAPEIMLGASKKLMLHGEAFFGYDISRFNFDGASFYAKYRFYSADEVHCHFRMAAYGKIASSDNPVTQPAIDLAGRNSGAEAGIVATKLMYKIAVSAGGSFVHAWDNSGNNKFVLGRGSRNAFNYNLSFGKLFLPKIYKTYRQVNLNGMLEGLGQTNAGTGRSFIDLAPSIQLIFFSRMRLDMGYRFPVLNSLSREQDRGFLLRLEYNFFNAYK